MNDKGDPLVGKVVADRFRILERLAAGGMGVVYKAEQVPLGRKVAVKILRNPVNPTIDLQFGKRFLLEAAAVAGLSHPNTITVHDYGQVDDETLYLAMEYLDGQTVADRCADRGPVEPLHAIHIALQIAGSLGEAHSQGLVHRDLKPGNVMIMKRGANPLFVKVLDFGLVKMVGQDQSLELTQSGVMMGSPAYMAPEQVQARDVDHRCDIYSFGVILYFMLTGHPPFNGESQFEVMRAHVCSEPPPFRHMFPACRAPASLEQLTLHCLRKHPGERPQTMDDIAQSLMNCEAELGYSRPMSSAGFPIPHASGSVPGVQSFSHPGIPVGSIAHQPTPMEGHVREASPGSGVRTNYSGGQMVHQSQPNPMYQSGPNPMYQSGPNMGYHSGPTPPGIQHPNHASGMNPAFQPSNGAFPGVAGYVNTAGMQQEAPGRRWLWQVLVVVGVAALAAGVAFAYPLFQSPTRPEVHPEHVNTTNNNENNSGTDSTENNSNGTDQVGTPGHDPDVDGQHEEATIDDPPAVLLPVTVTVRPPVATISRGDEVLGAGAVDLQIPEGESWEISVAAPGFESRTIEVDGSSRDMEFRLVRQTGGAHDPENTTTMDVTMEEPPTMEPEMVETMEQPPTYIMVDDGIRDPWSMR